MNEMSGIDDNAIEKYREAGEIAKKALKYAIDIVSSKKNIDLYDLCEKIEKYIVIRGGLPAFPCNVSLNSIAAHYSPIRSDDIIKFTRGILKIDVGVMIDGYIADTAASIARGKEFEELTKTNYKILMNALELFRPGVKLGEIGRYIEDSAAKEGYRPIYNLSGHKIDRYELHAGKNVPNVHEIFSPKIVAGEVYAVEPFLTFRENKGSVSSGHEVTIYSLKKIKRIKKNKEIDEFKNRIFNRSRYLPFSPRWFYNSYGYDKTIKYIKILDELGYLRRYPILVEESGGIVSQYEHTIIVLEEESIITTI